MSLLFPLYLAGAAAVLAPIVLHLIRRTPGGRTPFGSLMFLRTSPPRLARRRRLDHLPLLALRALAILFLALAFARPYLGDGRRVGAAAEGASTVAVLVDASASMRDVWSEARRLARDAIDAAPAEARIALASFDRELRWLVSGDGDGDGDGDSRAQARSALAALEPGWAATDLGGALAAAAEHLASGLRGSQAGATLVVVSDLQAGADVGALEELDWPAGVELELARVATPPDNAALHPVPRTTPGSEGSADGALRVRVSNAGTSAVDRFELAWQDGEERPAGETVAVHCPPGESRVVRAPARPPGNAPGEVIDRLVLAGDARPFDNVLFDLPVEARPLVVPSVGAAEEPSDLDRFLEHAVASYAARPATVARHAALPPLDPATSPLVVVRAVRPPPPVAPLLEHARAGGVVLAVLDAPAPELDAGFVGALLGDPALTLAEGEVPHESALLGAVDFEHPLFRPFADPRYRDFTKVRFWRRRSVATETREMRVLVRFEDGLPFLLERRLGEGRVLVLASGWSPADSDLARSTKFAPLVHGLLGLGGAEDGATDVLVGDDARIRGIALDTSTPGHRAMEAGGRPLRYTVRLDPAESRTEPAALETLERLEVPVATGAERAARAEHTRRERARETEGREKLWRSFLLAAVAALYVETLWAGALARRADVRQDGA